MPKSILVSKMQNKLQELIYNQVLYNVRVKKAAAALLKSPLLIKNPIYKFFYNQLLAQKMKRFEKTPFRVMIENTNLCNANCTFCPHKKMKRRVGVMDMDLFKKIVNQCRHFGINYVSIYGFGEPLLDREFFAKIKYAKGVGIARVTTNTNAMYLSNKITQVLDSGLDEIYISFDALMVDTYKKIRPNLDFYIVERNILQLVSEKKKRKAKKPEIILSFVESQINECETADYLKKWRGIVDNISISFIHNWTGDIESGSVLKGGKRDPCRLLWTDMVISWNGDVPLCCNDYEGKIILGNVSNETIEQIWSGAKLAKIREKHKKGLFNKISLCRNCEYNYHHKSPWWVGK